MEGISATDLVTPAITISSAVSDVAVVETDKDSSLLVSAIFTVISMFRITIIVPNEFESNMNSNIQYHIHFIPSLNSSDKVIKQKPNKCKIAGSKYSNRAVTMG